LRILGLSTDIGSSESLLLAAKYQDELNINPATQTLPSTNRPPTVHHEGDPLSARTICDAIPSDYSLPELQ
jgi:hypothetical protein